jgi:carbon monoxide dehydrogenase subunit G
MDITGTYPFPAPPTRVWDLRMDPAALASCIPGCESLEPDGENRFRARLKVAMAAITGTYDGVVQLTDVVPHQSYKLLVEGQGRPGFVKGTATIVLSAEGDGTVVAVTGSVQTGGPVARVGQRLISGVAKMMQDRFFTCLQERIRASSDSL